MIMKKNKDIPITKEEPKKYSFQKYQPTFVTTDGKEHKGIAYNWICEDQLYSPVQNYLMTEIIKDGYIEDMNGLMYPVSNVMSVFFELLEAQTITPKTAFCNICYTDEEFKQIGGV